MPFGCTQATLHLKTTHPHKVFGFAKIY